MLFIYGTDALATSLYRCLPEADRKNVCFVASDGHKPPDAQLQVTQLEHLPAEKVTKLLLPSAGIFGASPKRDRAVYRMLLQKTQLRDDQIWLLDAGSFARELSDHGCLEAFLSSDRIPYIFHLEFEVTHHCNLNCRGCTHFAPLSEKRFASLDSFVKDLTRIREMVDHVQHIQLMGGEPLLNGELYRFVEETRRIYPDTEINVVTNGMLLGSIDDALKQTMRKANAAFMVTLYPPIKNYVINVMRQTERLGIRCSSGPDASEFYSVLNIDGSSDAAMAEARCGMCFCHMFGDGMLSRCNLAHKIQVYERYYHLDRHFPDCRLDLYAHDLTPQKLQAYLMGPIDLCRYCGKPRFFPWAPAGRKPKQEEWYCERPYTSSEQR